VPAPAAVEIVEVAARDGLQNESRLVATSTKRELIGRLLGAGVRRLEVASFVHPKRVPSMADAELVCAGLPRTEGARYSGLVLNEAGFDRARTAGLDELTMVVVATDTFSRRNQGMTTAESAMVWRRVATRARDAGLMTSVTIAAAFGCPFEGEVPLARLTEVAALVAAGEPDEIVLADTIGVGVPTQVADLIGVIRAVAPGVRVRGHFHNTRNTAVANVVAAFNAGVTAFDSSVGGIGGCPFAPGATGNVATEDLVYLFDRMRVTTGITLAGLLGIVPWLEGQLGHPAAGQLSRAGMFPNPSGHPTCLD
jgi:hydroxymethylglutaryl-CoA lyase